MKCSLCKFGPASTATPAEYVIGGYSVCEDHVDYANKDYSLGRILSGLWEDFKAGQ